MLGAPADHLASGFRPFHPLLDALGKGDEVVTQGGIAGRITKVGEDFVTMAISDNVEIQMQKPAITLVLPKGTLKSL